LSTHQIVQQAVFTSQTTYLSLKLLIRNIIYQKETPKLEINHDASIIDGDWGLFDEGCEEN
jgi:hypothetical protein